jgi:hypothetical protein
MPLAAEVDERAQIGKQNAFLLHAHYCDGRRGIAAGVVRLCSLSRVADLPMSSIVEAHPLQMCASPRLARLIAFLR